MSLNLLSPILLCLSNYCTSLSLLSLNLPPLSLLSVNLLFVSQLTVSQPALSFSLMCLSTYCLSVYCLSAYSLSVYCLSTCCLSLSLPVSHRTLSHFMSPSSPSHLVSQFTVSRLIECHCTRPSFDLITIINSKDTQVTDFRRNW